MMHQRAKSSLKGRPPGSSSEPRLPPASDQKGRASSLGLSIGTTRNNLQFQTTTQLSKIEELDSARYTNNRPGKRSRLGRSQNAKLPPLASSQFSTEVTSPTAGKRLQNSVRALDSNLADSSTNIGQPATTRQNETPPFSVRENSFMKKAMQLQRTRTKSQAVQKPADVTRFFQTAGQPAQKLTGGEQGENPTGGLLKRAAQKTLAANSPEFNAGTKIPPSKSVTAFGDFLKAYIRESKDSKTAMIMANRMGILLSETSIAKLLEDNMGTMERFRTLSSNASGDAQLDKRRRQGDQQSIGQAVKSVRLSKTELKSALLKRYKRPVADRVVEAFAATTSFITMGYEKYLGMLQENLLAQYQVRENFAVPRYFKLYFDLLDHGDKGFVCEHDIFEFTQDLEGLTNKKQKGPTAPKRLSKLQADDSASIDELLEQKLLSIVMEEQMDVSRYDMTYDARSRNDGNSLFTETFSDDSIILYSALQNAAANSRAHKRDGLELAALNETQNSHRNSHSQKPSTDRVPNRVGQAVFKSPQRSPGTSKARDKKRKAQQEAGSDFEMLNANIDKHLADLKEYIEDAKQAINNKNSSKHQKFMQELALKVVPGHSNAFSHENKKFGQLALEKSQRLESVVAIGYPNPQTALKCSRITFEQFALLAFKDDVPQFVNSLFKFLTGADLRELLRPNATQNQFSRQINAKLSKKKDALLAQRYSPLQILQRNLRPSLDQKRDEMRYRQLVKVERVMEKEAIEPLKESFWQLCENQVPKELLPSEKEWCSLYCTQQSIVRNFVHVMGYRNDVLASRLYNMLAEKQRLKRVYLPTFLIKLRGLVEGSAMEMNMFAFNIIDGDQDGVLAGNDIADINKCVKHCLPMSDEHPMVRLEGCSEATDYSQLDKRCKCAFAQEWMAIFSKYYELNLEVTLRVKGKININRFQHIVKLSCIAVEFRDKLLRRGLYPRLLGHSVLGPDGHPKAYSQQENDKAQQEIAGFIRQLNQDKARAKQEISRELESNLSMIKKCQEMVQAQKDLEDEVIGSQYERRQTEIKVNRWLASLSGNYTAEKKEDDQDEQTSQGDSLSNDDLSLSCYDDERSMAPSSSLNVRSAAASRQVPSSRQAVRPGEKYGADGMSLLKVGQLDAINSPKGSQRENASKFRKGAGALRQQNALAQRQDSQQAEIGTQGQLSPGMRDAVNDLKKVTQRRHQSFRSGDIDNTLAISSSRRSQASAAIDKKHMD